MSILSSQVDVVGRVFLSRRPLVVGPLAAWTIVTLLLTGAPRTQLTVVAVGMSLGFTFFVTEAVLARRAKISQRWLYGSLLVTVLAVSVAATALGGLGGPFLPMLFAPAGVGFAAFGVSSRSLSLWGVMTAVLLAWLVIPSPFPPLSPSAHRLIAVGAASTSVLLLLLGVGSLASAYVAASRRVIEASDEVIASAHARTRAVEELTGHFAHELKNPLAAIKGAVELLAESATDPRSQRRLEVATREVERLERVLRQGLDFTRPVSSARREPNRFDDLARSVASVAQVEAERRGVRLDVEGPPVELAADAHLLKSALLNLTLNALEATPPNGRVTLSWTLALTHLFVRVQDTGGGMNAQTLARVGEPFFTTREQGTGLGVALARQVAAQHGGTLTFTSVEGQGTCATLTLSR
jgi:signal transduction histidine kinase